MQDKFYTTIARKLSLRNAEGFSSHTTLLQNPTDRLSIRDSLIGPRQIGFFGLLAHQLLVLKLDETLSSRSPPSSEQTRMQLWAMPSRLTKAGQ